MSYKIYFKKESNDLIWYYKYYVLYKFIKFMTVWFNTRLKLYFFVIRGTTDWFQVKVIISGIFYSLWACLCRTCLVRDHNVPCHNFFGNHFVRYHNYSVLHFVNTLSHMSRLIFCHTLPQLWFQFYSPNFLFAVIVCRKFGVTNYYTNQIGHNFRQWLFKLHGWLD